MALYYKKRRKKTLKPLVLAALGLSYEDRLTSVLRSRIRTYSHKRTYGKKGGGRGLNMHTSTRTLESAKYTTKRLRRGRIQTPYLHRALAFRMLGHNIMNIFQL